MVRINTIVILLTFIITTIVVEARGKIKGSRKNIVDKKYEQQQQGKKGRRYLKEDKGGGGGKGDKGGGGGGESSLFGGDLGGLGGILDLLVGGEGDGGGGDDGQSISELIGIGTEIANLVGVDLPCFSSNNNVEVLGKGKTSIDNLVVGDYVKSTPSYSLLSNQKNNIDNNYSRVISMAHIDHNLEAAFLQIQYNKPNNVDDDKSYIEITKKHLIFVEGKGIIRADEVQIGDILQYKDDQQQEEENVVVTNIQLINRIGVYAPITENGNLFVNNIKSSSYYAFMDYVPTYYQHILTHYYFVPKRLLCNNYNFNMCINEKHNNNGYTYYTSLSMFTMIKLNEYFNYASIQYVLAILTLCTLLPLYIFEQIINYKFTSIASFIVFIMLQKKYKKKAA